MKKYRLLFIIAVVLLLFVPPLLTVQAQPPAKESTTVRVGIFDYGDLFWDKTTTLGGYGIDYLNELANYTGWQYEYIRGTWVELLNALEKGEIDLLFPAQKTPERAGRFAFSKHEGGVEYTALYVPDTSTDIYYGDTDSFQGLRVAMVNGFYQNEVFDRYAAENSIRYTPVYYDSWSETDRAINSGEADARVSGTLHHLPSEKIVLKIEPEPYYFIAPKNSDNILAALDAAMNQIEAWDPGFSYRLGERYSNSTQVGRTALSKEEADYIASNNTLRVAYNANWIPLIYQNDGRPEGILYALLRQIASTGGLNFTFVPAQSIQEMERMLAENEVDLLAYYPRTRQQKLHPIEITLTKSYMDIPLSLAVHSDLSKSLSKVEDIAIPTGQSDIARIALELYPNASIHYYPDAYACLNAVNTARVDAALENDFISSQLLKSFDNIDLIAQTSGPYSVHIGISPGADSRLLSILNKSITQLTTEEVNTAVLTNSVQAVNTHLIYHLWQQHWVGIVAALTLIAALVILRWKRVLERHAYTDPLTGCRNQAKFVRDIKRRLHDHYNGRYALVCFDIDRFKVINDIYGFRGGNQVLLEAANALASCVERDELFCRSSGDNFIALLTNDQTLEARVGFWLDKIRTIPWTEEHLRFMVSAGVYVMNEPIDDIHIAIDRANLARQHAKMSYDKLVIYNETMRKQVLRKQEIESSFDKALANNEFVVYYQPKYSVNNNEIIGAEALVRWIPSSGKLIYPDEFIPVLENNASIVKLDLYVFSRVCEHLSKWLQAGFSPYPISVNLSRVHLYQEHFYREYLSIMRRYQVPFYLVELELTESTLFENQQQLIIVLEQLRKQGLLISMDDFGSGYSSLNLLKDLPIDTLKLDREFFNTSMNNRRGMTIIESIVHMAQQLDILVVSEGVETEEQVAFLRKIHCNVAQGYFYAKPLPLEEYEACAYTARATTPK